MMKTLHNNDLTERNETEPVPTTPASAASEKYVGCPVGDDVPIADVPLVAFSRGAKSFEFFTGDHTRWMPAPIDDRAAEAFRENCARCGFSPRMILPHAKLLINLAGSDKRKLSLSRLSLTDELKRCSQLGLTMLNIHAGAHLRQIDMDTACDRISEGINHALDRTQGVTVVVESSAGQGTQVGHEFEHLARIIHGVEDKTRVGVCIDTCHTYSAGYDLATPEGYDETWRRFDDIVGRKYLMGMHLNDDKRELGSHIDRHEMIGKGHIGQDFFRRLMNDPRFDNMPLILETPAPDGWSEEIRMLYHMTEQHPPAAE